MSQTIQEEPNAKARPESRKPWIIVLVIGLAAASARWPGDALATATFVVNGMVEVAPLVIPGLLVSAWVNASGAGGHIARAFEGNRFLAVLMASAVGAVTPVCGVTVLPLMAGLLASGVPLAPVMAFWLSSPVTDPAMFAVTAATLGFGFAVAKSLAAFGIGLAGGLATAGLSSLAWTRNPLRRTGLVATLEVTSCCAPDSFEFAIWADASRRQQFMKELYATTRLVMICLTFAFAAEHLMHSLLQPEALTAYVGTQSAWAVPLAVFVGAPAYLDGYAALPLTRGMIDHGMSQGAAMAFLVSGSVVSIWGAMAIFPVLKAKPFLLYLALAVTGSLASGWLYELAS